MTLDQVAQALQADVLVHGDAWQSIDVDFACGCDLISDILAFVKNKTILLTGLTNIQLIKTVQVLDIPAIVFVRGKRPSEDFVKAAELADIPILVTQHTMYVACGLLYQAGLKG
ncbi:hypothetical protein [Mahella australiensis]|uniref:DRTGG domain-containing protein n=1 Tax=Mahella australiensis (strain DSM 15567 / CIP 107919 / 50-1 BON) TaxID=697281 RepID=F3ZW60_MAHA5|nr:hypothetical protein [Mahella australiensis]AEE96440.1 DRTGG domain-containing protein [Mahella australiensis 50-1 BON]